MKNKSLLFIRIALLAILIFLLTAFISKQFAQVSIKDKGSVKKILIDKIRITKDTVMSLQDSIENEQIRKLDSVESAEINMQRDKIEKVRAEINKSEMFDSTEKSAFNNIIDKTPEAVEQVKNIVEKVNYNQNKVAIDRLTSLMASAQKIGLGIMIVLILMALLITFNTIRLAIYIAREEISVMKLVGASSTYIRGPFIVGGMLYGLIAGIITLVLFYPVTAWLGKETANFFIGINIFDYYISNFGQIFLIIIVSGVVIGAISSFLAVRRYLH